MSVPQSSFAPAPPLKGRMPNMPLLIFFIFLTRTRELTRKPESPESRKPRKLGLLVPGPGFLYSLYSSQGTNNTTPTSHHPEP